RLPRQAARAKSTDADVAAQPGRGGPQRLRCGADGGEHLGRRVMSVEPASLPRAARRIEWSMKALVAAADDLQAVGATGAREVVEDEADCLGQLAAAVRALHAPAKP